MIELKPCPFCGGEARKMGTEMNCTKHIYILCINCGASSPIVRVNNPRIKDEDNLSIKLWNRRVKENETN